VPLARAEEARAQWLERFPEGFEERALGSQVELVAYTEAEPPPDALVEEVEPGWEERWRDYHQGVRVGRLWVGPPWQQHPHGTVPVVIDPGRAFGTGAHPTTRLCVQLVAELEPASVLDVGCGSGVIAIAAARLGHAPVVAVDVDAAAVEATTRNANANGVSIDVRMLDVTTEPLPQAELVVANLSRRLAHTVLAKTDARLVIASGYLERDRIELAAHRLRERRVLDGWAADLLERAE
jgi:ribosomal protein L11 methyltransferase